VGLLRIHPHAILEFLAYAVGFRLFLFLRSRWGDAVPERVRLSVVVGAAVGAALGSKLLFWLQVPSLTLAHVHDPAFLMGGKSIVGGLLGGLIGVELAKSIEGERRSTGDLFVLPLCLGMAIGRVGCFLAGLADHTYGVATAVPWGVDFGDGVARHPTQLYEIVALAAIAWWAAVARRRDPRPGDVFRGFMVLYLGFRLAIEFIKPDVGEYLGLTGIQMACLAGLVYYARDMPRVFSSRQGAPDHGRPSPAVPLL
jgi:phosphatidylglycerol:prolipoprotein diacylglycerol transferase